MIKAVNVSKSFDGRLVIDNISATFHQGKINQIIGQSGSGKTVLLKSLVGLYHIEKGEIYYNDTLFSAIDRKGRQELRKKIGMLFQGGALFDSVSVLEM